MAEAIYVPRSSAKLRKIKGQNGEEFEILSVSFGVTELIDFAEANENEKGFLNLEIKKRKEEGKFGDTHAITLNTWKKEETK